MKAEEKHYYKPDPGSPDERFCLRCGKYFTDKVHYRRCMSFIVMHEWESIQEEQS